MTLVFCRVSQSTVTHQKALYHKSKRTGTSAVEHWESSRKVRRCTQNQGEDTFIWRMPPAV